MFAPSAKTSLNDASNVEDTALLPAKRNPGSLTAVADSKVKDSSQMVTFISYVQPAIESEVGTLTAADKGKFPIFINQIIAFASPLKGLPVKVAVMEDGCPFTPIQGAILRGAPHPNAGRVFMNHLISTQSQVIYAKAWMGVVTKGVDDELTDPDAKRFTQLKLMGSVALEDRELLLKRATELFK